MRLRALLIASLFIATPLIADPPARVVRLNLTDGIVSFRPAGIDEWTDAPVNRPLIDGDELWTDSSARAEMHIGSTAVRLAPSTSFGILNHTDGLVQLRLTSGTMNIRIRHAAADDIWEIDTPNASVSLLRPGRYRVDVAEDGYTTLVAARGGEAEVAAGGSSFVVRAGEEANIRGDRDATYEIASAPRSDDFDRWCSDRDQREERIAATRYIPRDVVGYEDLDAYGEWVVVGDYGWAWRPTRVVAGWAPYRYGHWAWIEPWGWTWIDDARWGFAPFHYGRWAYDRGYWWWVPGRIERPVYAPALVAFGGGSGWRPGVTIWWPLAPGEVYLPAYHAAPAYVRRINAPVVNVTNINITNINVTNIDYRNRRVAGGVTAVSHEAFIGARPVAGATVSVSVQQAMAVHAIGTTAPVAPSFTSVVGHSPSARVAHPPSNVVARTVFATRTPPPPPLPFKLKQEALIQTPGQPLTATTEERLRVGHAVPTTGAVVQTPLKAPNDETLKRRTFKKETTTTTTTSAPQTTTTTYTPPRTTTTGFKPPVTTTTTTTAPATTTNPPPHRLHTPPVTTTAPPPATTTNPPPHRKGSEVTTTTTTTTKTTTSETKERKAKKPEKEKDKDNKKDQ